MSEKSVAAIKSIVAAGYQLDKSCLELLRLIEDKVDPARLAAEVLNEASKAKLWPPVIDKLLLEKVALRISPDKTIGPETVLPTVVSTTIPYAKEVQARIEILDKQLEKRSKAEIGDFARYFRTRFRKIQEILNERVDVRGAGTIGQALEVLAQREGTLHCHDNG